MRRRRFEDLWEHLPPLLVLAALPGWGKSTWLRQCTDHLPRHSPDVECR